MCIYIYNVFSTFLKDGTRSTFPITSLSLSFWGFWGTEGAFQPNPRQGVLNMWSAHFPRWLVLIFAKIWLVLGDSRLQHGKSGGCAQMVSWLDFAALSFPEELWELSSSDLIQFHDGIWTRTQWNWRPSLQQLHLRIFGVPNNPTNKRLTNQVFVQLIWNEWILPVFKPCSTTLKPAFCARATNGPCDRWLEGHMKISSCLVIGILSQMSGIS